MGGRARLSLVAIGCVLLAVALTTALTRAVPVRTGTNETLVTDSLGGTVGRVDVCQDAEPIPAGTGAVRVSLFAPNHSGPPLALVATNGRATIGRGTLAAGWSGEAATIPLRPVARGQRPARICVTIGAAASVVVAGEANADPSTGRSATATGARLKGRLRFEYLAPASPRLALAGRRHLTADGLRTRTRRRLGRARLGAADARRRNPRAVAARARRAVSPPTASERPLRRSRLHTDGAVAALLGVWRRIPSAAWACALVAILNCAAWSLVTPAFQVPDEPDHYAYVEQLATAQRPPANDAAARSVLSSSEQTALAGLGTERTRFHGYAPTIATQAQQDALRESLAARPLAQRRQRRHARRQPAAAALLRARARPVRARRRRLAAEEPGADASAVRAARRGHRAVRVPVPARSAARPTRGPGRWARSPSPSSRCSRSSRAA